MKKSWMIWILFIGLGACHLSPECCQPSSEARLLFNGSDFSAWTGVDGGVVPWKIIDRVMEVVPQSGSIITREVYQDFKLHVEFKVPVLPQPAPDADRGNRGNSGVYLQHRYEVQILDSFGVTPEAYDCGALYRARAPDTNACKPAGEWQTYDITFCSPRFLGEGEDLLKIQNARITVYHNNVLIHHDVELENKTGLGQPEGPTPGPILLQDHGNPVQFRNIWITPLDP